MRRNDWRAAGIMGIPAPLRAARQTGGVNAQKVTGPFYVFGRKLRGNLLDLLGRITVLQQHKGPQKPPLRTAGRGFADIMASRCAFLYLRTHIAKLRSRKHIGSFRHPRNIRLIHISSGCLHPFERLKWMRPTDIITPRIGVVIATAGTTMPSHDPIEGLQSQFGLCRH